MNRLASGERWHVGLSTADPPASPGGRRRFAAVAEGRMQPVRAAWGHGAGRGHVPLVKSGLMALVPLEQPQPASVSCGFCWLGDGKAPRFYPPDICSSRQNALPIRHLETFLTFSLLVQFPGTYLCSCPYSPCPCLSNQNVCAVFQ